jgi:hypothetical protein
MPFVGIEGIYEIADGESRIKALIEMMGITAKARVSPDSLLNAS